MSILNRSNDVHLSVDENIRPHLRKLVHRFRVEVHNLRAYEEEERAGKSENHVTLSMLLGSNESVRIDMAPNQQTNLGRMEVLYRKAIVSGRAIRVTDVKARGSRNDFEPDRKPARSDPASSYTVDQVLMALINNNVHRYRFAYIDSQPLGCRHWITEVLQLLQHLGCFRNDANLTVGEDGCQSPSHLLACQWDMRQDDGQIITRAPGNFLVARPASFMDTGGLVQRLGCVTPTTLTRLAWAMDRRTEENLGQNFQTWIRSFESAMRGARDRRAVQTQFAGQRNQYLRQFAQLANLEGFEARMAEDLAAAPSVSQLSNFLRGRYDEASSCLAVSRQIPEADRFVWMLIAVCIMAGAENKDEDEDEDED